MTAEPLLPKHGGYEKLRSFQVAQLAYDVTVRFCERYIDRFSRTRDQMVQAARSVRSSRSRSNKPRSTPSHEFTSAATRRTRCGFTGRSRRGSR